MIKIPKEDDSRFPREKKAFSHFSFSIRPGEEESSSLQTDSGGSVFLETPRKGKDSQKGALYVNSERLEKREM